MSANETIQGIGAFLLICGVLIGFFGYKIYRFLLALTGFVLGGLLGFLIFGISSQEYGTALIGFFLGSCIGAWVLPKIERLAIAISVGIIGVIISVVFLLWDRAAYIYYPNVLYYVLNNPINLLMFIIFSFIGWILYKWAIIIMTAGDGASLMAFGGTMMGLWDAQYYPSALIGTLVLGVVVQAYQEQNTLKQNMPPSITNLYSNTYLSKYFPSSQRKFLPSINHISPGTNLPYVIDRKQEPIVVDPTHPRPIPGQRPLPNLRIPSYPKQVTCNTCGHLNRDIAKYCNNCGSDISIIRKACVNCGQYNRLQARYCSHCGKEISGIRDTDNTMIW